MIRALLVFGLLGVLSSAPASAAGMDLAGTWIATVNGQQFELVLEADGSARLLQERGRWQADGGVIVLANQNGRIQGQVSGEQLVFQVQGNTLVFVRARRAAAPAQAPAAAPAARATGSFTPDKILKGKTFQAPGGAMSFTVPDGWNGQPVQQGESAGFSFTTAGAPGSILLVAVNLLGREERQLPMGELLHRGLALVAGQISVTTDEERTFAIAGRPAGRLLGHASVPGPDGATRELEIYVAGVVVDEFVVGFVGAYEVGKKDLLRPGLDTMLASFKSQKPPRNAALERQVAGCWESGSSGKNNSSKSSYYTSAYMRFGADGTYSEQSSFNLHVSDDNLSGSAGADETKHGTFVIYDALIVFTPNSGQPFMRNIRLDRGALTVGKIQYIPCI